MGTAAETVTKRWLYRDGLSPVAELDGSGAIVARYVYGSRANVPDLVIKGGKTYRLFVDHLGSPRMAVNVADTSEVPYRVDYSAFGVPTPIGSTSLDWIPFGFAGGLSDPGTGLVRFGSRDYDPILGRWLSKDPIRFDGGQDNIYAYVNNDPVNAADPSGLDGGAVAVGLGICWASGVCEAGAGLAAIGAAVAATVAVCMAAMPSEQECKKQWREGYAKCGHLLTEPRTRQNGRMRGNHENVHDCAAGFVSEVCGGNIVAPAY